MGNRRRRGVTCKNLSNKKKEGSSATAQLRKKNNIREPAERMAGTIQIEKIFWPFRFLPFFFKLRLIMLMTSRHFGDAGLETV